MHLCTHLNRNIGLFYLRSEGLLMIRIQNVCGKSISNVSSSNFGRGYMMALSALSGFIIH